MTIVKSTNGPVGIDNQIYIYVQSVTSSRFVTFWSVITPVGSRANDPTLLLRTHQLHAPTTVAHGYRAGAECLSQAGGGYTRWLAACISPPLELLGDDGLDEGGGVTVPCHLRASQHWARHALHAGLGQHARCLLLPHATSRE
jgi:hypothetical protein